MGKLVHLVSPDFTIAAESDLPITRRFNMTLPIISLSESSSIDLQPWLLIKKLEDGQLEVSLWSIEQVGMAISIFSSLDRAEQYRTQLYGERTTQTSSEFERGAWQSLQPSEVELGQILVAHYRAGVKWLVLDPSHQSAKRIFSMVDVLKALKEKLSARS